MESLAVHGCAATTPDGDAPRDHRLNCCGVKGPLQHCRDLTFPQPSEVIQALPHLLHWGGDVGGPCQVHRDLDSEVPVVVCALHRGSVDHERGVMTPLLLPPKVHNHLLGLGHVQVQLVSLAP